MQTSNSRGVYEIILNIGCKTLLRKIFYITQVPGVLGVQRFRMITISATKSTKVFNHVGNSKSLDSSQVSHLSLSAVVFTYFVRLLIYIPEMQV